MTNSLHPITDKVKPLSLRANVSWTFVGNVVYAASQWGILVVLARLGTPEMVGQFALGLAVTAPVMMFANLQLRAIQATDAKHDYTFGEYLGLRMVTTLLALLIIGVIALTGYIGETLIIVLLVGVTKAIEAHSDVVYGLLQQHERMDRIAFSLMIKGPSSLIALTLGVLLTESVAGGVVGMIVVWGFLLIRYDLRSVRFVLDMMTTLRPQWQPDRLLHLTWLALPLGFVMMLISLNTNIPRIFVEQYLGEAQLGIFAAMAYLIVAGNTVVGALGQSASPRLAKYYAADLRSEFLQLLGKLMLIATLLGGAGVIVAIFAGEFILSLLYGEVYAARADVFVWIMVGASLMYIGNFLGYAITATRRFHRFTIPYIMNTIIILLASVTLIPVHGLNGAAWVLCIGGLMSCMTPLFILLTTKDK